jgi:hypothetical protein
MGVRLTKPFRNPLTLFNFISALTGGVDGFLAACTVWRIYEYSAWSAGQGALRLTFSLSAPTRLVCSSSWALIASLLELAYFSTMTYDHLRKHQGPHLRIPLLHLKTLSFPILRSNQVRPRPESRFLRDSRWEQSREMGK